MFEHFIVKNFRCFSSFDLQQLGRVNLIAGKNNTGKTALLEAIHLHNNPTHWQLPININKLRGIEEPINSLEDVCGWLFRDKLTTNGLELVSYDEKATMRTLAIFFLDAATSRERFPEPEKFLTSAFGPRLILKFEQSNEPVRVSIGAAGLPGAGHSWVSARNSWNMLSVFLSSSVTPLGQDVKFFGELEAAKRQEEILPALQILEPRLRRLSLVPLAGESVIHGDIGLPRLVPVPFMGEGMRRVLSIVLAIANAPGGVVLIDEVENGLHYSVLKDVWAAIVVAAHRLNVQIFATSHSWDCIQGLQEAAAEFPDAGVNLIRLERQAQSTKAVFFNQSELAIVTRDNIEVR